MDFFSNFLTEMPLRVGKYQTIAQSELTDNCHLFALFMFSWLKKQQ